MENLRKNFLDRLYTILQEGYQPSVIAKYAYEFYLDYDIDDEKLAYVVDYVKGMDASPEFELSQSELISFIGDNLC
ncbi:hypothetical protein VA7868_01056 [Vibrio aerogenes CECT 7868]|uniref:Uncharacterized protein n=1 Tax=Vibrio aerogenes CECT 7868 TaxID=1216006 RepID=A0A1M5XAG7_9VIBR|nr:hypothetical protein [Vibrio aerogenes]SHH96642.1 hypothetical protein VA7868_01056 [Vibrio aerogenes CECT 7868]